MVKKNFNTSCPRIKKSTKKKRLSKKKLISRTGKIYFITPELSFYGVEKTKIEEPLKSKLQQRVTLGSSKKCLKWRDLRATKNMDFLFVQWSYSIQNFIVFFVSLVVCSNVCGNWFCALTFIKFNVFCTKLGNVAFSTHVL